MWREFITFTKRSLVQSTSFCAFHIAYIIRRHRSPGPPANGHAPYRRGGLHGAEKSISDRITVDEWTENGNEKRKLIIRARGMLIAFVNPVRYVRSVPRVLGAGCFNYRILYRERGGHRNNWIYAFSMYNGISSVHTHTYMWLGDNPQTI